MRGADRRWCVGLLALSLGCAGSNGTDAGRPDAAAPGIDAAVAADATADAAAAPDATMPADGGADAGPEADGGPMGHESDQLVVVTLNTHAFQEGPSSIDKLERIGAGLAQLDADLVGLNEVMSGDFSAFGTQDAADLVQDALEAATGVTYHRATYGWARWDSGELMSNVILSRYPITATDHRDLTTTDFWPAPNAGARAVVYGRVDVPRVGAVDVFVTHTAGTHSSMSEATTQAEEVKAFMASKGTDADLQLLVGDLNVPPDWPVFTTFLSDPPQLVDTFGVTNRETPNAPTKWSGSNRIDYVLASSDAAIVQGGLRFTSRLVFDETDLPRVSDHKGVVTVFTVDP